MPGVTQWLALVGLVITAFVFVAELLRWRAPGSVLGPRQKAVRVSLLVLMEALFVMILAGPLITAGRGVVGELIHWTICLTLGLAICLLALFDLRSVVNQFSARSRRAMSDFVRDTERDKK